MSRIKTYKGQYLSKNCPLAFIFSTINVHLVDINVFAKFYGIPSLPFKDIEKNKTLQTDNVKTVYPLQHSLRGI